MISRHALARVVFAYGGLVVLAGAAWRQQAAPAQSPGAPQTQTHPAPSQPTPAQPATPAPTPQPAEPSPIEFESKGMEYEALTKEGITVMFAPLPPRIKEYSIMQVTVTNGSLVSWTVKSSDFSFVRQDGTQLPPVSADEVVESLLEKASRNDVIKLQLLYENTIYALSNFRSTNGYEQRREAAMAQFVNRGFTAAAAASAITLVPTKLKPGDSTDGAVFFENKSKEKTLGAGRFIARTCGQTFMFETYQELKLR
ncbi:MAG: hypothetical protein JO340_03470 [Acidobacteriaceae bacterium]|nr:hypothetical protein [Acidobacteriaceae bacterium]